MAEEGDEMTMRVGRREKVVEVAGEGNVPDEKLAEGGREGESY